MYADKLSSAQRVEQIIIVLPWIMINCFDVMCTDESDTSKVQDLIDTIDNTSSVIKD